MAAQYVLGLDYGDERVGVAIAQQIARLPRPLTTLQNNESLIDEIQLVVDREDIGCVVVGVPRNMDGTESTQSRTCREFASVIAQKLTMPVETIDETLSSIEAEKILKQLGKPYKKSDIDAMSAVLILERYFDEQKGDL